MSEYIECETTKVMAKSGSSLDKCIRECIELSMRKGHNVELIHNEVSVIINWGSLLNRVYEDNAKNNKLIFTLH